MRLRTSTMVTVVLALTLLPVPLAAQGVQQRVAQLCELQAERMQAVAARFSERLATLEERKAQVAPSVQLQRRETASEVQQLHQAFDARYQKWFESYAADASEEARTAAGVFIERLRSLTAERREALAGARETYYAKLDQLRAERLVEMTAAAQRFRAEAEAVFASAGTRCRSGDDTRELRADFIAKLRDARLAYAADRRTYPTFKEQMKAAEQQRDEAVAEAQKAFEIGVHEALAVFRQVDSSVR